MIRPLEESDIEQVLKIWLDASVRSHSFVDGSFWLSKVSDMRDIYLPSGNTYVYEEQGSVLGFASLCDNTLAALFVAPGMQGRGIGKRLMAKVKEMRKKLTLRAYRENPGSIAFYERCGFEKIREQTDELTGHAEIVMTWKS